MKVVTKKIEKTNKNIVKKKEGHLQTNISG